jgi:hypothetical protein
MVESRSRPPNSRDRPPLAQRLYRGLRQLAIPATMLLLFSNPGLALEKASDNGGLKTEWGAETACYSRYMSRGIASSEGPVLQPSAWVALNDFTLSYFGNYVLTREKQQGRFNEADISLAWGRQWNGFEIEPKVTLYTYPNTEDQSQYEAGFTLARDLGHWTLSTFNSVTFAAAEQTSYYGEIALGYRQDFLEKLSFTAELAFSWPTLAATLEGKLPYRLTEGVSLFLHAGCSITPSDAASSDNHASSSQDTLSQGRAGFIGLGLEFKF